MSRLLCCAPTSIGLLGLPYNTLISPAKVCHQPVGSQLLRW
jgi:hypothetical protein